MRKKLFTELFAAKFAYCINNQKGVYKQVALEFVQSKGVYDSNSFYKTIQPN